MRAVLEQSGIKDVVAKSLGSQNPINVVRATISALGQLGENNTCLLYTSPSPRD